jgi:glycine cleavage system aminomethyltransferase T
MTQRVYACECKEGASIKISALFDLQLRAGASFTELYGWQVPASYRSAEGEASDLRAGVGLADVSWTVKLDLKGYGVKKGLSLGEKAYCWALGSNHSLVTCNPPARDEVLEQLKNLQAAGADLSLPPPVYVTDVTSVYAQFLLAGARSRDVLRKLSSLNVSEVSLPDRACGQANLAHVRAIILRQDLGSMPAFNVQVSREYGESVWEAILHAGHEFELVPFGCEAQRLLNI